MLVLPVLKGFPMALKASHALELTNQFEADGWLVAPADDTGVDALREICRPCHGNWSGCHAGPPALLSARYSILTPMQRSVAIPWKTMPTAMDGCIPQGVSCAESAGAGYLPKTLI